MAAFAFPIRKQYQNTAFHPKINFHPRERLHMAEGVYSGFQLGIVMDATRDPKIRGEYVTAGLINAVFELWFQLGPALYTVAGGGDSPIRNPQLTADLFHAFAEGAFDAALDKYYTGWIKRHRPTNGRLFGALGVGVGAMLRDLGRYMLNGKTYTDGSGEEWLLDEEQHSLSRQLLSAFLGGLFSDAAGLKIDLLRGPLPPAVRRRGAASLERLFRHLESEEVVQDLCDAVAGWFHKVVGKELNELLPDDE